MLISRDTLLCYSAKSEMDIILLIFDDVVIPLFLFGLEKTARIYLEILQLEKEKEEAKAKERGKLKVYTIIKHMPTHCYFSTVAFCTCHKATKFR